MKSICAAVLIVASSGTARGQGTVVFSNLFRPAVDAPVYQSDRVTRLSGSQFQAELLAGRSELSMASVATTGFFSGDGAGYFDGRVVYVNSVGPGQLAWMEVQVWNIASGASFLDAQASGLPNSWWQSSVFPVITGGVGVPPSPPALLVGLGTLPVYLNGVPEPSAVALAALGAALALLRGRRARTGRAPPRRNL